MRKHSCCFTGHRIIKKIHRPVIEKNLTEVLEFLIESVKVKHFFAGGALGFDTLAATTVLTLKERYPDISLHLILPCKTQSFNWQDEDKDLYNLIIKDADSVEYIDDDYTKECMMKRNRALVDSSLYCLYYMYKNNGGTFYTVNYAKRNNLFLVNLNEDFIEI